MPNIKSKYNIVIPIQHYGRDLLDVIAVIVDNYVCVDTKDNTLNLDIKFNVVNSIYRECVEQILRIYTPDYTNFCYEIMTLPNTDMIVGGDEIRCCSDYPSLVRKSQELANKIWYEIQVNNLNLLFISDINLLGINNYNLLICITT